MKKDKFRKFFSQPISATISFSNIIVFSSLISRKLIYLHIRFLVTVCYNYNIKIHDISLCTYILYFAHFIVCAFLKYVKIINLLIKLAI